MKDNKVVQLISSGGAIHDRIRTEVILQCQRKGYDVFSEATMGSFKPDLEVRKKNEAYYLEIQKAITEAWVQKKMEQYRGKTLIIIDTNRFSMNMTLEALRERVSDQLALELHPARKPPNALRIAKTKPERNYYNYRGHRIKRGNERRIDFIVDRKERLK